MSERCDVLIAGGGSAGLAAAVAAARSGARTVLIERHGVLGGMATAALVHSVCGLYRISTAATPIPANPGFATEFATRLIRIGGSAGPVRMGRVDVLPHHPTAFARLADLIASETAGLRLRFHTELIAARGGRRIGEVEVVCRGRRETIHPNILIDASGDAAAAYLAGAGCEQAESGRLQRPAYIFALGGIAHADLGERSRLRIAHRIASAVRRGELDSGALGASLRASGRPGEVMVTIDLEGPPDIPYDPTDADCLSVLERQGRELAWQVTDSLRREVDGFASSYIASFPARVGVRESRRVIGCFRLEGKDILSGARFDDTIALASWPIELRERATGARLRFAEGGEPCGIPLRALCALDIENLLVAGRCISASHEAQASIRVIGTCMATGEAAGLAAALLAGQPGSSPDARAVCEARERVMMPHVERAARAA